MYEFLTRKVVKNICLHHFQIIQMFVLNGFYYYPFHPFALLSIIQMIELCIFAENS